MFIIFEYKYLKQIILPKHYEFMENKIKIKSELGSNIKMIINKK